MVTCHACNGEVEKGDELLVPRWPGGVFRFHASNLMCRKAASRRAAHVFPALSGRVGKRANRTMLGTVAHEPG